MTDSVNELTIGGNLRLSPLVGTNLGFTIYQSLYDKVLDPQIRETILGGDDPDYSGDTYYLTYMTNSADPEINAMYQSSSTSNLWSNSKSSRGAVGFDFTSVIKNIAIQGEFGTLMKNWNYKSFKKSH